MSCVVANHDSDFNPSRVRMRFCVLAGGSKGNSVYVSDGTTAILMDAGLSGIEIQRRLQSLGIHPQDLDAIVVSHEHADHIHGVGVLSRRWNLPVYLNEKTRLAGESRMGCLNEIREFECGLDFTVNTLSIHPFSLSHDAEDPAGFTVHRDHLKLGIATDLGIATSMVKLHLRDCDALILEANHDPRMLENGPYPWPLKQRISGRCGHLSNEDSRNLLAEVRCANLRHVVLSHLSEQNNCPETAVRAVSEALSDGKASLSVAHQQFSTPILTIE